MILRKGAPYIPSINNGQAEGTPDVDANTAKTREEAAASARCKFKPNDRVTIHDAGIFKPATATGVVLEVRPSNYGYYAVIQTEAGVLRRGVAGLRVAKEKA